MQISAAVCVSVVLVPRLAAIPRVALGARRRHCRYCRETPPSVRASRLLLQTEGSGFFSLFATEHGHNEKEAELDLHRQFLNSLRQFLFRANYFNHIEDHSHNSHRKVDVSLDDN